MKAINVGLLGIGTVDGGRSRTPPQRRGLARRAAADSITVGPL